ncbi:FecR domain-containing protein [Roseateles chitosanitabidus]|uniref:FecR domain-containing protein n=1 Tax=Roseateles chitosanitabidus TaxID=65048 RepID=UPI00082F78EF|nr:FecR domain-containing protein [Roseateles chitosanitabidus]MBO9688203.1 FecR domain-containing protein [Roseateles chitosanitabidus]
MTGTRRAPEELPPAVVEAAVAWMVKLQSGWATPQEHQACDHWQRERPEHARAWADLQAFSQRVKTLPPALARGTLAAARQSERAPRRRAVLKGVVLLAGTAGIGFAAAPDGGWPALMASHRTGIGERRRVVLADGSVLQLNTATALDARVDAHRRCVDLFSGEVLIECVRDRATPSTPFVVRTAQGRLQTAAGRFIVRQLDGRTSVQALEGWIDAQPSREATTATRHRLGPGQQWSFDALGAGPAGTIDGSAGAWVNGLLVARDMPLAELVAELARYRKGWLRCDPAVARLRISGVFPLDNLDRVVAALQRTLPVRARAITAWWVTLEPR